MTCNGRAAAEAVRSRLEPPIGARPGDAVQCHQICDLPEADGGDVTGPRGIEHAPFAGGKSLWCDPRPEDEMGVDKYSGNHLLGSKSRMTASGRVKSSDRKTPLSSPYLIGFRPGNGPRQATARPVRVTTIVSPASARATRCPLVTLPAVVPKAVSAAAGPVGTTRPAPRTRRSRPMPAIGSRSFRCCRRSSPPA
jgi:hypothetical protein